MWSHSKLDHLARFEMFIRDTFVEKEHILTIFFDLEKAYDTTWKHGILADLRGSWIQGPFLQVYSDSCHNILSGLE